MSLFFMCLKIFSARLIDVSLGTFRTINTIKGKDLIASLIGLVEITVWFLVVKEALNTDNNSFYIIASYALGFSVGTYIGGKISSMFIKSSFEMQVILSKKDDNIVDKIRERGFGVTVIEIKNNRYMLYIEVNNNSLERLKKLIRNLDKKAFVTVTETKYVENGYFGLEK